jgi:hypothetical protein
VVIALHAPEMIPTLLGTADLEEATALVEGNPPVETMSLKFVQVPSDGRFTIEATFVVGGEVMRRHDY